MVVALIVGTLIIGHRELWCLVRGRKLPVLDERVRVNASKAVRNGFVFFAVACACLMLFFSVNRSADPQIVHVLGGLFLSAGMVYLFSYLFYDRVEPGLSERRSKMLKMFLLVAGISLGAFIISAVLHNALSGLFGVEEPVFFCIAVFVAPLGLVVGIVGSLVLFIRGLVAGPG